MPRRRVTRGRRATSAEPALIGEPTHNLSVAENEEQRLLMRLPEAELERDRGRHQPGLRQGGLAREGGSASGCLRRRRRRRTCPRVSLRRPHLLRQR